ncbi:protein HEATR9 isoform X2 [Oryctolagus cuniculus]|uniref:protein HEATR9 isoform X2 n=1 Tax=Oryctolagus cuniculus TaxID=9986 RepID=UPI002230BA58|nr:protein HEATR9 isoform X2 [Oryctolagus cuniculus]
MSYERKTDIFDISRLMLKYPWLEYRDRTKELREAMAPVRLPMSCYQVPKEVYPPSPDCWRQHSQKPSVIPYCYSETPETDMHWNILYNQQEEWETQRMLAKMRDQPRYLQQETHIQNFYLPMNKLTSKAQAIPEPLEPTRDPLKWQRLKELMKSLKSPQEDEQLYAAQALGYLDVSDKFVMEALWQVGNGRSQKPSACLRPTAKAQTGSEKVKYEAYRSLAILGCLNKHVIHALIKQLKGQDEGRRMETLTGLRVALNSWAAVPKDKTLMKKLVNEAALEAALCLGFLRPCSDMAQEFLLQCLCQGPKTQRMKALRMLVKMMHVHSAAVIMSILEQLCSSAVLDDRYEATQMLRTIGLEQIQAQGLEELTFDLLRRKTHNEPFLAMRQAVVETVEELRMKPVMMNTVEEQLMDPNATTRQEAITSLGVLGFRSPQVFHLLLDMLDTEENQAVKKSLQETLVLWSSTDPWIQSKLKNKIFLAYEAPKTNVEAAFTRFRKKPETPEQLTIQDFRLARLSPLLIAKASTKMDQKKRLPAFLPCLPQDMGHSP